MAASPEGSLAVVVALDGSQVIGMGRLVGDGVTYFYVQELAVLPAYQGRGIGRTAQRSTRTRSRPTAGVLGSSNIATGIRR
jgi:ribosomal protein S18 acetylase RimI-like enzyme